MEHTDVLKAKIRHEIENEIVKPQNKIISELIDSHQLKVDQLSKLKEEHENTLRKHKLVILEHEALLNPSHKLQMENKIRNEIEKELVEPQNNIIEELLESHRENIDHLETVKHEHATEVAMHRKLIVDLKHSNSIKPALLEADIRSKVHSELVQPQNEIIQELLSKHKEYKDEISTLQKDVTYINDEIMLESEIASNRLREMHQILDSKTNVQNELEEARYNIEARDYKIFEREKSHDMWRCSLEDKHADTKQKLEHLQAEYDGIRQKEIDRENFLNTKDVPKDQYESEVNVLHKIYEKGLKDLRTNLHHRFAAKEDAWKSMFSLEFDELQNEYKAEIDNMKEKHSTQVIDMEIAVQTAIHTIENGAKREINSLKDQIKQYQSMKISQEMSFKKKQRPRQAPPLRPTDSPSTFSIR